MSTRSTLILAADAVDEGTVLGLSVAQTCEVFRQLIEEAATPPIWARSSWSPYLTERWVELLALEEAGSLTVRKRRSAELSEEWPSSSDIPTADNEGFGVIIDKNKMQAAAIWRKSLLQYQEERGGAPGKLTLSDVHFDRSTILRLLRAAALQIGAQRVRQRSGGRPAAYDYEACSAAVLAQIINDPAPFLGVDGRIRQNSDRLHQRSVVGAAREFLEGERGGTAPDEATLRRQVAKRIKPALEHAGFKTWG